MDIQGGGGRKKIKKAEFLLPNGPAQLAGVPLALFHLECGTATRKTVKAESSIITLNTRPGACLSLLGITTFM